MRNLILFVVGIAAGAVGFILLRAGTPAAADPSGGPEVTLSDRAEAIATNCATCHGTAGRLVTTIPSLAGKSETVLRAQLLAFKRDETPGATVMPRLTKGYSDEDIEAVARHFASLSPDED